MTYNRFAARNHKMPSADTVKAYLDANPEFRAMEESNSSILRDFWNSIHYWGKLTEKQEAVARRILTENAERDANREAKRAEVIQQIRDGVIQGVPTGKDRRVEGEVLGMKWRDSQYGSTLKMRVKTDEGWTVWGTVPSRWHDNPDEEENLHPGDRVAFYAEVTASDDDPSFGFFKRPKMFKRTFAAPYEKEEVA
jgi:hypothetical protein